MSPGALAPAALALSGALAVLPASAQTGEGFVNATTALGGGRGGAEGGQTGGSGFRITPTLSAQLSLTDNVNLSATDKQSQFLLGVAPGIQISGGSSGRIRGSLSYSLGGYYYINDPDNSNFYNLLNAAGTAEIWENRFFIDASASISQQIVDPFGTQSADPGLNNSNQTEVTTLSVSPYLKGQLAGQVDVLARGYYNTTLSGSSSASDSASYGGIVSLAGTTRWSRLSWGLNTSYRTIDFSQGRREYDWLSWLSLNYAITPELIATVRANHEQSNLTSLQGSSNFGWGGGLQWNPSPITRLVLQYDQRIFGSSHLYLFEIRSPRTIWTISSTQSLSNGQASGGQAFFGFAAPGTTGGGTPVYDPSAGGNGQPVTAYSLLFAQFASVQPDPVLRAQLVSNFLKANNIDPNSTLFVGYLPSQVTEQLAQNASVAWLGLRSNVIFSVYQTQSRNLGPLSNPGNNFANGDPIRWYGGSASWSHRLTPRDTLSVNFSGQRTSSDGGGESSNLYFGTITWSSQIARRVTLSLTARRQVFDSTTNPYNENALLATATMTF
jgi:hypothetical protein